MALLSPIRMTSVATGFALRCFACRCVAFRFVLFRFVSFHSVALRCVALRCVALRCVALRCARFLCAFLICCNGSHPITLSLAWLRHPVPRHNSSRFKPLPFWLKVFAKLRVLITTYSAGHPVLRHFVLPIVSHLNQSIVHSCTCFRALRFALLSLRRGCPCLDFAGATRMQPS